MSVTIETLNTMCQTIADLRIKEAEAKRPLEAIKEELKAAEDSLMNVLVENEMKSYRAPSGLAKVSAFTSVKLPKEPGDINAFYDYLKKHGLYDGMISVNSTKLNGWYREKFEEAIAMGNTSLEIPGIGEPVISPRLSFGK